MEVHLNDLQRQAVLHDRGPLMVLAGPGTGKTRILIERVRHLINQGVAPDEICLVTFTTKAADEIKNRLGMNVGKDFVDQLKASTLHSLALRIMIANERAKKQRIPEVADPSICFGYLKRAIKEVGVLEQNYSTIEMWNYLTWFKTALIPDITLLPGAAQKVVRRYNHILKSEAKWDLSDLITKASDILRNEPELAVAFSTIRYLMVDEFQDTSMREYEFLKLLLSGNDNFMTVAAAAQSIYSWRGGDFETLKEKVQEDFPNVQKIVLRENYRCGQHITEAAAAMTPEEDEVRLNSNRGDGRVAWKELPDNFAEANFVANTILELKEKGIPLPGIAILFRSWRQSAAIEQSLVERQIPYKLFSEKKKFYERSEIQEMVAYVQAIQALRDYNEGLTEIPVMGGAIDRIINTPPRGIGPRSKKLIRGEATEITVDSLVRAMARKDLREQVKVAAFDLFNLLNRFAKEDISRPNELIGKLMEETEWIRQLQQELDGRQAVSRLRTLQEEAATYRRLRDFLKAMSTKVSFKMDDNGVALTTIHGAKGLEWPVVFVVGFTEGELPSIMSLRETAGRDPVEERHVAHVAFSRAKDLLIVSWFKERVREDGRVFPVNRSSFVGRVPQEVWHEFSEADLEIASDHDVFEDYYADEDEAFEVLIG